MFEAHIQVTIYYTLLTIFVLAISFLFLTKTKMVKIYSSKIIWFLVVFCILFIGWREWRVREVFVDSAYYGNEYLNLAYVNIAEVKDIGFYLLQKICASLYLSVNSFFIVCASLYVIPQALVAKNISKEYGFIVFLMMIVFFQFYNYGVNGIRNGLAFSFLLLSFVNYKKKISFVCYAIIAILFHKSAILPFLAFICASRFNKSIKPYLFVWIMSIPLSFFVKESVADLLLSINFVSERAEGYLIGEADIDEFSHVGFRYDFVLYSFAPIIVGMYFILKKNFANIFYRILYCTYVLANASWVLINSVPYSNRFAVLSWFIMPLIMIFPFIFCPDIKYRYLKITGMLIANLFFLLII